ncbi:MAG: helix-turn-helix domain-containing protein [Bacteroidota bacterium]
MKQPEIGSTISNLRNQKGLTQEEFALRCGLNTNTVQQIESGSIKPDKKSLEIISVELKYDLILDDDNDSKFWLVTLHLSNFFCIVVIPLVIWIMKKEEDPEIDRQGRDVINFQLSMMLYLFASAILVFVLIGIVFLLVLGGYITIITIINTMKVISENDYKYPLTIRFIK